MHSKLPKGYNRKRKLTHATMLTIQEMAPVAIDVTVGNQIEEV